MPDKKDQDAVDRLRGEEDGWRQQDMARSLVKSPLRRAEFHTGQRF